MLLQNSQIYIFKSAYPSLFALICDVSLSPTPPSLCPYLSYGIFKSLPSFSAIDFSILSMSGLPPPSPLVTPTSLYTVLYSYSPFLTHPFFARLPQSSPAYIGINLPLTKPLLNDFFFSLPFLPLQSF